MVRKHYKHWLVAFHPHLPRSQLQTVDVTVGSAREYAAVSDYTILIRKWIFPKFNTMKSSFLTFVKLGIILGATQNGWHFFVAL